MSNRKIQVIVLLILVIMAFFSYYLGIQINKGSSRKNFIYSNYERETVDRHDSSEDKYPQGGNKRIREEEVIIGQKPLTHDSTMSEDILYESHSQSAYMKKNLVIEDDREDVIITNESDSADTVETSTTKEMYQDETIETALNISNPRIRIEGKSGILLDKETGNVLYHKNAAQRVYPASTTKIMTAIVVLRNAKLTDRVVVGEEINLMASDSSRAYLNEGEELTVEMLLEALLLPSGNDAAYTLSTFIGKKIANDNSIGIKESIGVFVDEMNNVVDELKLKDTHFMNPDGYDDDNQYTTAYDMAMISRYALNYHEIIKIAQLESVRNIFLSGEDVTWKSGNKLLIKGSGVYYPYAIGLKSGTSSLAGRCLVSAAKKDEQTVISVIMNSTAQGRWEDSIALLRYGLENE